MVAAPWAAKLVADLGADVIKVEPPEGDRARRRGPFPPDRRAAFDAALADGALASRALPSDEAAEPTSGLFVYLNTNKRSVVADLTTDDGRATLDELLADADLFFYDLIGEQAKRACLSAADLRARHPHLASVAITPFGQTGPYANYVAEELQVLNAGGWGWLSPGCIDDADLPPLKPHGHQAAFQAGVAAAAAGVAAADRAQRTGRGEHLDFAQMAYVAGMLEAGFLTYPYTGDVPSRLGARVINPWRMLRCADGRIFVVCVEADQWERLKDLMGRPDWADMDIFRDLDGRFENADLLHMWLGEWTASQQVSELFHRGQAQRIAFAPVNTIGQMSVDEHLNERGFLASLDQPGLGEVKVPGPLSRLENPWWQLRRPAPALGVDAGCSFERARHAANVATESAAPAGRPLEGITIADFSWVWAGPYCSLYLAHLGATVLKIESSVRPDLGRRLPLHSVHHPQTLDTNGYFNQWAQGKRSVSIDMSHPDGRALAKRLALKADAVLSNYAFGVMERWGLSYEALAAERPDVIVGVISGYGHTGPYRNYMGYGPAMGPLSGLASMTGYIGGDPEELGVALGDPAAGIATTFGLTAALMARRQTGEGQLVDTSLWEATTACVAEGWMEWLLTGSQPERNGNRDPLMCPHGVFRCAGDDRWVAIACADEAQWRALAGVVAEEAEGLADDSRFATAGARKEHEDELEVLLGAWTASRDMDDITKTLQAVGVPAFGSLSAVELERDPHLVARGVIERLEHPVVGPMAHIGVPWIAHDGPNGVAAPAPTLGQHTDEVLREFLALDDAEIASLREAGALR